MPSDTYNEAQAVAAAQQNTQAFEILYEKNYESIFRFLWRRTGEEELAADLAAQTFVKALINIQNYEYKGVPFSAWLYRIASNELNKHYRSSKKIPVYSLEEKTAKKLLELSEEEPNALEQERLYKLQQILQTLKPADMQLIELRFFEDKSFKEIAYILDSTESASKMRLYRILEKMKKNF